MKGEQQKSYEKHSNIREHKFVGTVHITVSGMNNMFS